MKTISSAKQVYALVEGIQRLILEVSPWILELWDAVEIGYVFILNDEDIGQVTQVYTSPPYEDLDDDYREVMTINLSSFDLWEIPAIHDPITGYWNAVVIFGAEYGCSLFM